MNTYICQKCQKSYTTKDALNAHQRVHSLKPRSGIDVLKMKQITEKKRLDRIARYNLNPKFCKQCQTIFVYDDTIKGNLKKIFCSHSCAATYNNQHKTTGTRRSKFEIFVEEKLKHDFPQLTIFFNDKTAINSELDIYIPQLHLAFELNGIFHYEPIFSHNKLIQIQNNDQQKIIQAYKANIELVIIDVSQIKYHILKNIQPYYDGIYNIIKENLPRLNG